MSLYILVTQLTRLINLIWNLGQMCKTAFFPFSSRPPIFFGYQSRGAEVASFAPAFTPRVVELVVSFTISKGLINPLSMQQAQPNSVLIKFFTRGTTPWKLTFSVKSLWDYRDFFSIFFTTSQFFWIPKSGSRSGVVCTSFHPKARVSWFFPPRASKG